MLRLHLQRLALTCTLMAAFIGGGLLFGQPAASPPGAASAQPHAITSTQRLAPAASVQATARDADEAEAEGEERQREGQHPPDRPSGAAPGVAGSAQRGMLDRVRDLVGRQRPRPHLAADAGARTGGVPPAPRHAAPAPGSDAAAGRPHARSGRGVARRRRGRPRPWAPAAHRCRGGSMRTHSAGGSAGSRRRSRPRRRADARRRTRRAAEPAGRARAAPGARDGASCRRGRQHLNRISAAKLLSE